MKNFTPPKSDNEVHTNVLAHIETSGWTKIAIGSDGVSPGFIYTIGLHANKNHPEIIAFGIAHEHAASIIDSVVDEINKQPIVPFKKYDEIVMGLNVCFVPVDSKHDGEYTLLDDWYYKGDGYPTLQLVWPDTEGHFPWEKEFDSRFDVAQPLLGSVPSDIKERS